MRLPFNAVYAIVILSTIIPKAQAGPIAWGLCQTGCNIAAIACYASAGAVFGTVAAPLAPPAILACNAMQGTCMAACTPVLLLPTP